MNEVKGTLLPNPFVVATPEQKALAQALDQLMSGIQDTPAAMALIRGCDVAITLRDSAKEIQVGALLPAEPDGVEDVTGVRRLMTVYANGLLYVLQAMPEEERALATMWLLHHVMAQAQELSEKPGKADG